MCHGSFPVSGPAYLNTQWTPTTTIAALTPRFSPRVPALEMWWLRNSSISPGPRRVIF